MPEVTDEMKQEIREIVYDFYAEECEVDRATLTDDTNVIEDIEGDSLMFPTPVRFSWPSFKTFRACFARSSMTAPETSRAPAPISRAFSSESPGSPNCSGSSSSHFSG